MACDTKIEHRRGSRPSHQSLVDEVEERSTGGEEEASGSFLPHDSRRQSWVSPSACALQHLFGEHHS